MNLEEIRQKFPQYNQFDDSQLANALYKKHYANKLEFSEFAQRIGYTPPEAAAPKAPPAPPPDSEMFPFLRQVADVPLKVGAGLVTGVRMIADAFGADTGIGQNLRGVEDYIASLYSAQSKNDSKEIGRIMKEAEDKGVADQVIAAAKAFAVAPVDMLANALGTAAPAVAAGLATTLGGAPLLVARGATLGVGALMGSGTVKGAIYDATKNALKENTNLPDKEIEARAIAAQEYGGKNLDQILIGSGLGALGSVMGIEPGLARQLARGIVSKEAVKEAIKKSAAKDTATAAERGIIKQGVVTGGKELATEFPQGAQEQLAQNIALQREGFDVPTMRGVVGQGALEGLAGFGLGAVTGGREAASAARELAGEKPSGQTEEQKKISDQTLKDQFTPAKNLERKAGKGFTQEAADLLMPASTTEGKALVEGVTRPDVTETIAPPTPPATTKKAKTEVIPFDQATPESIQAANDLIATADSGGKLKNPEIRKIGKAIGVKLPFTFSNAQGVQLIRDHLAQQGAPNVAGTDTDTSGTGAGVDTLAATTQPAAGTEGPKPGGMVSTGAVTQPNLGGASAQPATLTQGDISGTTTPEAQQTTAQGQAATAAGTAVTPKRLEDLSPEMQAEVARRQALIADIEMDGKDASKEKRFLNNFLAKQGVTGTLSARRETKSIEKDFLEEGELPYAVEGEEATGVALDRERVLAYKESLTDEKGKPRTIPDYEISKEDQQLYNEMREEINPQIKAANEKRSELVAAHEAALKAYDEAKAGPDEDAAFKALNAAEDALQEHGPIRRELPEYTDKFAADYKDVYFGNISAGPSVGGKRTFGSSRREHQQAAAALLEYLQKTGGKHKE